MIKTIEMHNGQRFTVINTLSYGPGTQIQSYVIQGFQGVEYVNRMGNRWVHHSGEGQFLPEISGFGYVVDVKEIE